MIHSPTNLLLGPNPIKTQNDTVRHLLLPFALQEAISSHQYRTSPSNAWTSERELSWPSYLLDCHLY